MKKIIIVSHLNLIIVALCFCLVGSIAILRPAKAAGICDTVTQIPRSECEVLVTFYNNTNGPNWVTPIWAQKWLSSNTPCNWFGVGCDQGHVTEIAIGGDRGLRGRLPSELRNLSYLQSLELPNHQLYGNIPPALGSLTNLRSLHLEDNQFTGTIPPELGQLANLRSLDLTANQLTGSIPPQLGSCSNLVYLSLAANQLTGSIPPELGNLTLLENLGLNTNQLIGTIPSQIGNLINLEGFGLYDNQLSGVIPAEIGNLTLLHSLYLNDNQLSGDIPPEIGNLVNLAYLHLENNQLTGIPPEFGNLANLKQAYLDHNHLSGHIPPELGNLAVEYLYLNNNHLGGSIPSEIGNISDLYILRLDNNQLSGRIPPELGNLGVYNLYLNNNQLSGQVPPELGDISPTMDRLILNDNLLSGPLPANLTRQSRLRFFYFNNTGLCEPEDASLQSWLNGIDYLERSGIACTPPQTISSGGGNLVSQDGQVIVQFPAGAVSSPTVVTYTYYAPQPAEDLTGMDRFFGLEASQNGLPVTQFNRPITIELKYPTHHVLTEDSIDLYWLNNTAWVTDDISVVSKTETSLIGLTDHFTLFAVLGETNSYFFPLIMKH